MANANQLMSMGRLLDPSGFDQYHQSAIDQGISPNDMVRQLMDDPNSPGPTFDNLLHPIYAAGPEVHADLRFEDSLGRLGGQPGFQHLYDLARPSFVQNHPYLQGREEDLNPEMQQFVSDARTALMDPGNINSQLPQLAARGTRLGIWDPNQAMDVALLAQKVPGTMDDYMEHHSQLLHRAGVEQATGQSTNENLTPAHGFIEGERIRRGITKSVLNNDYPSDQQHAQSVADEPHQPAEFMHHHYSRDNWFSRLKDFRGYDGR